MDAMRELDRRQEGARAAITGKSYDTCPYPDDDSRAEHWKRGWAQTFERQQNRQYTQDTGNPVPQYKPHDSDPWSKIPHWKRMRDKNRED